MDIHMIASAMKRFIVVIACISLVHAAFCDASSISMSSQVKKTELADGSTVLICTNTSSIGEFTLLQNAKAEILVIGGGGAGGSTDGKMAVAAGGGGAGGVLSRSLILETGTYQMEVGSGGKRVQTTVQSWIGANGGNSEIRTSSGEIVAIGKGGGGGGTAKLAGDGQSGGSGGGGSWFEKFTKAGSGIDGQGWHGGASTNILIGAGGGGAALDALAGAGKPDGQGGAGRVSAITGEQVEYACGGRGGDLVDTAYVPQDGSTFGSGGDGAASGKGGAGADGVVIVKITKLFTYTKVPAPEYQTNFTWVASKTCSPFNLDTSALRDAVDYVEGTTQVVCSVDGATTNGLGRFWFALHLKDEYRWDDGSLNGSDSTPVFYWHVVEEGVVGAVTVDATKSVEWADGTNAVIAITVHSTPEKIENAPSILMLGSLCNKHGYSSTVATTALNTMAKVGNVDYYYFNQGEDDPAYSGSLARGETTSTEFEMKQSNHGVIYGFYSKIAELIDEGKFSAYDYIVFAIDRAQVATYFTKGTHAREAEVSRAIAPFYEKNAVIWLVDNEGVNDTLTLNGVVVSQTPWFPCAIVRCRQNNWYTLGRYEYNYGSKTQPYGYTAYKALIGMFSPSMYDYICVQDNYKPMTTGSSDSMTYSDLMSMCDISMTNTPQCVYSSASDVEHLLAETIKAKPSTIRLSDSIYVEMGLNMVGASGQWTTNAALVGWTDLTAENLVVTTNGVEITLPGIKDEADIRLKMQVADGGSFLTSRNATYNEKTGMWEKDPNNGPVKVSVVPDGGATVLAEAKASTTVQWSFPTHKIRGEIIYGEGEIVLNGFVVDEIEVADGTSPEIVYRGKGGWVLDYLEVDGQAIDFEKDDYSWVFSEVAGDHVVKVGFKSLLTVPYPEVLDVEHVYDGTAYAPGVTEPTFIDGYYYEWKAAYSFTEDGEFAPTNGQVNVVRSSDGTVVSTSVYVRVWIAQPGYENGVVIDGWTGVGNVAILPREATVKYDDYVQTTTTRKTSGFTYSLESGSLVEGDAFTDDAGQCSRYPDRGSMTEDSITSSGSLKITTPGCSTSNYALTILPGDYWYPDLQLVAHAPNVDKIYDGIPTSTVVMVTYPENVLPSSTNYSEWVGGSIGNVSRRGNRSGTCTATTNRTRTVVESICTVKYSIDGVAWTEEKPTCVDAGSCALKYRVECTTKSWTETESGTLSGTFTRSGTWNYTYSYTWSSTAWSGTVSKASSDVVSEYTPYEGTATITIHKRPVYVHAKSASKRYDGAPLTESGFSVDSADDESGFVGTDGITALSMTPDSS